MNTYKYFSRPNSFKRCLCIVHIILRLSLNNGQIYDWPLSWDISITPGSVDGSSIYLTQVKGDPDRAVTVTENKSGYNWRKSKQCPRAALRNGRSTVHWPDNKWTGAASGTPHPGILHVPSPPSHLDLSWSWRYRPVRSLAWTVAALTADGELKQLDHNGWVWPFNGRKAGRRKIRLFLCWTSWHNLECQTWVTRAFTAFFQEFLAGGSLRTRRGSGKE